MTQNMESAIALELDKVLEHIAGYALTPMAAADIGASPRLQRVDAIAAALAKVTACRNLLDTGDSLPLESFDDLDRVFSHLALPGSVLPAESLVALSRVVRIARQARSFISERQEQFPALWELARDLVPAKAFEEEIRKAIDPTSFEILDSASPELRKIRREIETSQKSVRNRLQQILQKAAEKDLLQEQLITFREGRLVLMVKDEYRRKIRGIVHDQSASGQTLFVEPIETVALNNRVRQLFAEERAEIDRLLAVLSDLARGLLPEFRLNYTRLIALDCVHAKARFSREFGGNAAVVRDDGVITLYAARHPLLLTKYKNPQKVVPLELQLGRQFNTLVITGPNAGGKTVAMKTAGLAVLMTRLGLHICASADSEIGIMGEVFVDIGDQQSIENDLSTFSSHMNKLANILAYARRNDLVLIDEIGSGTDPEEGTALALATLRALNDRGVRSIVTTHHGALKIFAHETPGVENGSMVFDVETLQPTYQFRPGVPGSSYAFDIATRIGLAPAVIAAARAMVGTEKGHAEKLITDLETRLQQQQELINKLQIEEIRLAGLTKLYETKAAELSANERKLKQQAIAAAEEIVARANATIEEAIRTIREQQASQEAIRESKTRIEQEKQELAHESQKLAAADHDGDNGKPALTPEQVQPGIEVRWRKQQIQATVLAAPDADNRVFIQAGSLRLRVPLDELEATGRKRAVRSGSVKVSKVENVRQEIDLRGKRAEEAVAEVDRYLSEALLYGWQEVRIIHGKGTGALRKTIAEHLQQHPNVAEFGPAAIGQGDFGVTVVRFR